MFFVRESCLRLSGLIWCCPEMQPRAPIMPFSRFVSQKLVAGLQNIKRFELIHLTLWLCSQQSLGTWAALSPFGPCHQQPYERGSVFFKRHLAWVSRQSLVGCPSPWLLFDQVEPHFGLTRRWTVSLFAGKDAGSIRGCSKSTSKKLQLQLLLKEWPTEDSRRRVESLVGSFPQILQKSIFFKNCFIPEATWPKLWWSGDVGNNMAFFQWRNLCLHHQYRWEPSGRHGKCAAWALDLTKCECVTFPLKLSLPTSA